MFYCSDCAKKVGYPESIVKSYGPCEICDYPAVCNDRPSRSLPMPDQAAMRKIVEERDAANPHNQTP